MVGELRTGSGYRPEHERDVRQKLAAKSPLDDAIDDLSRPQQGVQTLDKETPEARRQRLEIARNKLGPYLAEQTNLQVVEEQLQAALDAGVTYFTYEQQLYEVLDLQQQILNFKNRLITTAQVSNPIRKAAGLYQGK